MKQIKPGMPCMLRDTLDHDGKVVIPDVHVGNTKFTLRVGGVEMAPSIEDSWHLTAPLIAIDGREADVVPTRCLFPLDNPGEDETDIFVRELPKVRKLENETL